MIKKWLTTGTVLLSLFFLLGLVGLAQPVAPLGIIIEPPAPGGLEATIWVDEPAYQINEYLQVHFEVNEDAYIYVWDIDPTGGACLIYPNNYESNNYVSAGPHTIPGVGTYHLRVQEPTGTERLQIVATKSSVDGIVQFFGGFSKGSPFACSPSGRQAASQIDVVKSIIETTVPEDERAFDFTSFEIVSGIVPPYGTLIVNSFPPGAWITLNSTYVGYTPRTLHVHQGVYQIVLSKEGYQDWSRTGYIRGGDTHTINATLQPLAPVNQPPVASFTTSPPSPEVLEWVRFDGSSSYDPDGTITSYSWNFGDGNTGSVVAPYNRFAAPGTYTVTLTVTDDDGASDTKTHTVQVGPTNQPPVAAFNFSPTNPLVGGWVQFNGSASSDPDGTITSYAWNFGDGNTGSIVAPYNRFAAPGTYTVTLTVTDDDGASDTETHTVQVGPTNQPPVASFTISPPSPGVLEWVRFDGSSSYDPDGSISSYSWNFGDGNTGSIVAPYNRFAAPGTYTVTLTVTDDDGASDTEAHTVQVGPTNQPPVASFNYSPLSPGLGEQITLNATMSYDPDGNIVSYLWDRDGDGINDASGTLVTVSYYDVGVHVVRLTVVDNGGLSSTITQGIIIAVGGIPGGPPMGTTPGIFVWGTTTWHITVNAGAGWVNPHSYRLELRTDGSFKGVNQSTSGGVVPLGVIPAPTDSGKTLVFDGSLQAGSVDYMFTVPDSKSVWMSLKLDINGDGTLDESESFVYLRTMMVHPPAAPLVVGLPSGSSGPLVPSMNFRIGQASKYNEPCFLGPSCRLIWWMTDITTLEGH